jgi:hypothetical protein
MLVWPSWELRRGRLSGQCGRRLLDRPGSDRKRRRGLASCKSKTGGKS